MILKKIHTNLYVSLAFTLYIFWVIIYAYFSFNEEKNILYQYLDKQLEDAARTVPLLLPPNYHHQGMSATEQTQKESRQHILKLSEYTTKNDIVFVYTLILQNNKVFFTASSATKENTELGETFITYFMPYNDNNRLVANLFKTRKKTFLEYNDKWGSFRQIFIPMYSEDGTFYFTVAEMSIAHQQALVDNKFYQTLIITLLFLLATCSTYLASVYHIKKITQKLARNEERLSLGLKISNQVWFDHNILTGDFSVSDEYYQLLGYESSKFYSILDEWLSSVHKEDEKAVLNSYQQCLETGETFKVDYRIQTKSGEWLWFRSIAEVVERDKSHSPVRVIGSHLDISQDKNNEQQLRLAALEAKKANKAKSEFLSSMSHELRTPLNAILGFSQILEMDSNTPLTPNQKEKLSYISSGGNHLLALINDVLELSAIESGKINVSVEMIKLVDIVNESIALVQSIAQQSDIKLNLQAKEPSIVIAADYVRLKQILLNLLSNAIKYNSHGGSVFIDWHVTAGNLVRINITDTGIGIPEKKHAKVFDAFNRLGQEKSGIEGTGVGLMVTKSLVELMQGHIGFESVENKGSTFWIELPLTQEVVVPNMSVLETQVATLERHEQPPLKQQVLYVEDNSMNQKLMQAFFEKFESLELSMADSAEKGWEMVSKQVFDVILMDIHLPKMNGIEFTKHLKSLSNFKNIPVIAVTAAAMKEDINETKDLFDHYLTKPIDVLKLSNTLKKYQ